MKKLYIEPDFELINIRLLDDVLGASLPTEDPFAPPGGGDFEGGEGDFEGGDFEGWEEL